MGGSSKKQTVGYRYFIGCHMVISTGPIDALHAINVAERRVWTGDASGNQSIYLNAPELFGGEKKEGGIQGTIDLEMGGPSQGVNDYLDSVISGILPAFRGVVSVVLRQTYIGTNPYIKPWAFLASRLQNQSDGQAAWYPSRVAIEAPDGYDDMNPAHMIREALTNGDWGLGYSSSLDLDVSTFTAAADRFFDEGLGLSLELTQQEGTESFIRVVLEHADAALQVDPVSGQWTLKPIRDDYNIEDLPVADESNVLEVTRFRRPGWGEMTNQVSLVYEDREAGKERTVTVQDTALVQLQGYIVAQTVRRPGVSHGALAAQMAARELRQMSTPLANGELMVNAGLGFSLRVGSALVFNWPPLGIEDLVIRVVAIDYGNLMDGTVRLEFAQDVFATTEAVYAAPPPTGWQPPNNDPVPVSDRAVLEAPYWVLATDVIGQGPELDELVNDEGGYIMATGRQPVGDAYNFEIWTRTGSSDYEEQDPGDWVPAGTIESDAVREVQTTFTLLGATDLDQVEEDTLALLGGEWVRVLSVNPGASTVTVARGVLDTPPREHDAGTMIFFVEVGSGVAEQPYFDSEFPDVKLLTSTTKGTLALDDAPEDEIEMRARALLPYPPGNLQVRGERYPELLVAGDYDVTWSHRHRTQQTAYLVQQTEGDIGPEPGTTYRVRIFGDGSLLREEDGITGTLLDYTLEQQEQDAGGPMAERIRFEVAAQRDGYTSWASSIVEFEQEPIPSISDPTELSGLALWLDGDSLDSLNDGDPVALWADSSAEGHDFEQTTAGNQPTLRKNAWGARHFVHFDASRPDFLEGLHEALQFNPQADDFTIFAVVYQDVGEVQGSVIAWRDGSNVGYQFYNQPDSQPTVILSGSSVNAGDDYNAELTYFGMAVEAGEGGSLRVNNGVAGSGSVGTDTPPSSTDPVLVGARGAGSGATGYEYTGSIGEVVVYNRQLSGAEVLGLESYFRERWLDNLAVASPAQLPGLWSWYGADQVSGLSDGDPVPAWDDFTGNADASQTDSALQALWRASGLNGQPFLEFDATTLYDLAAALDELPYTMFAIMRGPTQDHDSLAVFIHTNGCALYFRDTGNMISVSGAPPTSGAGNRDGNWINDTDGHALWVGRSGNSTAEVLHNGDPIPTTSGSNYLSAGDAVIGSSSSSFVGEVYEIIIYNRLLSEPERKALEDWAAAKYGITFAE